MVLNGAKNLIIFLTSCYFTLHSFALSLFFIPSLSLSLSLSLSPYVIFFTIKQLMIDEALGLEAKENLTCNEQYNGLKYKSNVGYLQFTN